MSKLKDLNSQLIDVTVDEKLLNFTISREDYNRYINAVMPNNKVAPANNFCVATVNDESKSELKEILSNNPGSEVQIAAAVLEEYMPDLEITAKKRSASPAQ